MNLLTTGTDTEFKEWAINRTDTEYLPPITRTDPR